VTAIVVKCAQSVQVVKIVQVAIFANLIKIASTVKLAQIALVVFYAKIVIAAKCAQNWLSKQKLKTKLIFTYKVGASND